MRAHELRVDRRCSGIGDHAATDQQRRAGAGFAVITDVLPLHLAGAGAEIGQQQSQRIFGLGEVMAHVHVAHFVAFPGIGRAHPQNVHVANHPHEAGLVGASGGGTAAQPGIPLNPIVCCTRSALVGA